MRVNAAKSLLGGLGVGLMLAGVGATVFWMQEHPDASKEVIGIAPVRVDEPAERVMAEDHKTLEAKIEHLKGDKTRLEQSTAKMNQELASLRSQVTQLDQKQRSLARGIDEMTSAGLQTSKEAPVEAIPELTPEEESERAKAQTQAQIELLDQTLVAEQTDREWANSAHIELDRALQNEEMAGLTFIGKECRATMCRLELQLDGSPSPDKSFHRLAHLSPWQGAGFSWVNKEGYAVVYLAREGYSLPSYK